MASGYILFSMYENFRLVFSILWLVATGALLATLFVVVITWGGHLDYFYAAAVTWVRAARSGE